MEINEAEQKETHEENASTGKVTVTSGCYIDSSNQHSQFDIITKLIDLLECWNPYHKILKETYSINSINEFSDEIITELIDAINESIDDTQCATWINGGDFVITDCEE